MLNRSRAVLAMTVLFAAASAAHAKDDVANFYRGKQVRLVVGAPAGSGYDIMARAVAHHIGDHIPGRPSIIVENQPGAASIIMTNSLVTNEPHDGTVIGAAINGMPTAPLLQPGSVRFDPAKLIWLGSSDSDTQVAYVWHTAPVQSLKDLETKQLIVGADAPGTTHYDYPAAGAAILGLKFKIISGYSGTGDIHKAMEAGEVQGVGASAIASLEAMNPQWVANGDVKIIGLWNPSPSPLVDKSVPLVIDLAKTEADRQAIMLMVSRLEYGRPFFVAPGVPPDRAHALQQAFMDTMKDTEFLAEARKLRLDIDPRSGEQVDKLVKESAATPPAAVARLRNALAHP